MDTVFYQIRSMCASKHTNAENARICYTCGEPVREYVQRVSRPASGLVPQAVETEFVRWLDSESK